MPPQHGVHVGVAVIVQDTDDRVAMIRRGPNATHGANKWSFPGGWVDYGESTEEACIREVMEEVGLTVVTPVLLDVVTNTFDDQGWHIVCLVYGAVLLEGTLSNREPDKCDYVSWVTLADIPGLDLFGAVRSFVERNDLENFTV